MTPVSVSAAAHTWILVVLVLNWEYLLVKQALQAELLLLNRCPVRNPGQATKVVVLVHQIPLHNPAMPALLDCPVALAHMVLPTTLVVAQCSKIMLSCPTMLDQSNTMTVYKAVLMDKQPHTTLRSIHLLLDKLLVLLILPTLADIHCRLTQLV